MAKKTRKAKTKTVKKAKQVVRQAAETFAAPIDGERVYPTSTNDLTFWSAKFKTGYTQIKHAVAKVGTDPLDVQRWIEAKEISAVRTTN
jgi:hypothetical protein